MSVRQPIFTTDKINPFWFSFLIFMEMKRCFLLPSFITSRSVLTCNTFINHNFWTLFIYFDFGITYSNLHLLSCKFAKKKKNIFLNKKHVRDYIQLYSQPCLSDSFFRTLFFLFQHFFTKSKIVLSVLLKAFLLAFPMTVLH